MERFCEKSNKQNILYVFFNEIFDTNYSQNDLAEGCSIIYKP